MPPRATSSSCVPSSCNRPAERTTAHHQAGLVRLVLGAGLPFEALGLRVQAVSGLGALGARVGPTGALVVEGAQGHRAKEEHIVGGADELVGNGDGLSILPLVLRYGIQPDTLLIG